MPAPPHHPQPTPHEHDFHTKLRHCSPQERLFIRHKLERKSNTEAARLAGYSERTAHVQGSQLLRRLRVKDAYLAGLEANGFGPQDILGDIQDLRTFDRSEIEREVKVPAQAYGTRRVAELLPDVQRRLDAVRAYLNAQVPDEATLTLLRDRVSALQQEAVGYVERLALDPDAEVVTAEEVLVSKWVVCPDLARQKGLTRFIKAVKPGKYGDVTEVYDWLDGVEMGARALGLYRERHEVTGANGEALAAATVIVLPSNGRGP